MRRIVLFLILVSVSTGASAHKLKVFATVDGSAIAGYAFFIGGGRPQDATLIIQDAEGQELYRGSTDDTGTYSWQPPQPADLKIIVDAGDGHVADAKITRERFPSAEAAPQTAQAKINNDLPNSKVPDATPSSTVTGSCGANDIERLVGEAVSRQVRPLLEAYAEAGDRAKLTDLVGGIGMIFGLAGMAMWGFSRKRINSTGREL